MKAMVVWLLLAANAMGADVSSWQNLGAIRVGQKIEVRTGRDRFSGEFLRFDSQAVTIRDGKGERSLAQADVKQVLMAKSSSGIWIGVAAGGGGGLVAGALLGARLANESGGDFNNLKPAIAAACAGVGALIGAAVGASVRHGTVIYRR